MKEHIAIGFKTFFPLCASMNHRPKNVLIPAVTTRHSAVIS